MITWNELAVTEPRLRDLEDAVRAEAAAAVSDPMWSFSAYWSYAVRPALTALVGWNRPGTDRPQLRTEEAFDAAVSHLCALLPDESELMGRWAS